MPKIRSGNLDFNSRSIERCQGGVEPICCELSKSPYGLYHHVMECGKREKAKKEKYKKEKTKLKQDGVDIKPVTLQELMTEVKMVKKEIKEDNSIEIDKQNIAKIINLKDFPKPLTDSPVTDIIMADPLILL